MDWTLEWTGLWTGLDWTRGGVGAATFGYKRQRSNGTPPGCCESDGAGWLRQIRCCGGSQCNNEYSVSYLQIIITS